MRILYLDCFAGISGDMFLGALIDLGLDVDYLKKELKKISLGGYVIRTSRESRKGITGTRFVASVKEKQKERYLKDIIAIINRSKLSKGVKEKSIYLFKTLGKAEAKVHGMSIDRVHFHEVGAVDSIIDIIGAMIGIEKLGIDAIYSSNIRLETGMLGSMPLPAPAVVELLKGIPVNGVDRDVEMVTPTGAVLLKSLAKKFGPMPEMKIDKVGFGAGGRDDKDLPNVLRIILGEKLNPVRGKPPQAAAAVPVAGRTSDGVRWTDSVYVIETNIDDMNPQRYGGLMDRLFEKGALDVFWTSVQMKKNRPGILVTVLSPKKKLEDMIEILFNETTTFGIRYYETERRVLEREFEKIDGKKIKIGKYKGKICTIKPEYEDWKDADIRG